MAEPEWDQATRELVQAYDAVPMCPKCGGPAALCQDAERQDDWVAQPPIRCHATTARLVKQKGFTEESNPQLDALLWPVVLGPPSPRRPGG